jgi:hypothetical protein
MTQEERIREYVDHAIDRYRDQCGREFQRHAEWERDHIINCGTSVLCTKWKVGYPGGSFVQAIVDNDLQGVVGRADSINQDCIKFYVMLVHNTPYIQ